MGLVIKGQRAHFVVSESSLMEGSHSWSVSSVCLTDSVNENYWYKECRRAGTALWSINTNHLTLYIWTHWKIIGCIWSVVQSIVQVHFLKCSLTPGMTRMKNRCCYNRAQWKATQERKQISEVTHKQSSTFQKIKKPSITHTKCIIIRTSASSPHVWQLEVRTPTRKH